MAKADFQLKGVDKFMRNLNKEIRELENRTLQGLINAVIVLQRAAEPGTPIDEGNLRASWFSVTINGDAKTDLALVAFKGKDASSMRSDHNRVKAAALAAAKSLHKRSQPIVLFGYTANYAVFVHENIDAKFKRPGAKARWLYAAMQSVEKEMLEEIREEASF